MPERDTSCRARSRAAGTGRGAARRDQLRRAARGHRDDREPGGLRLDDHLAEGVRLRAEEEEVGVRVGASQFLAFEPAEKPGGAAQRGAVVVPAPLSRIPVWVRRGALIVTYPAEHVARGLGDTPEHSRPLEATLWGTPPCGRAVARLADGTVVRWTRGEWSVSGRRDRVEFRERAR